MNSWTLQTETKSGLFLIELGRQASNLQQKPRGSLMSDFLMTLASTQPIKPAHKKQQNSFESMQRKAIMIQGKCLFLTRKGKQQNWRLSSGFIAAYWNSQTRMIGNQPYPIISALNPIKYVITQRTVRAIWIVRLIRKASIRANTVDLPASQNHETVTWRRRMSHRKEKRMLRMANMELKLPQKQKNSLQIWKPKTVRIGALTKSRQMGMRTRETRKMARVEMKQNLQAKPIAFQQESASLYWPVRPLNMFKQCILCLEAGYNLSGGSTMTNYQRILGEFNRNGYYEDSELAEPELNQLMDNIARKNAGFPQFDRDIAQELWEHTRVGNNRTIMLRDYINTLVEAESTLREQYTLTEQEMRMEKNPSRRRELEEEYHEISNDHRLVSAQFKLPPLRITENLSDSRAGSQFGDSQRSRRMGESVIFAYESNNRESSSTDLKVCLFISLFVLAWELVIMFDKHHFYNILCIFFVLSIYFLNYFDSNYVKFLLGALGLSLLLDMIWLIVHTRFFWNPQPETQHSPLHTGFLVFTVIMVIILMVLRAIIAAILIKYRNMDESLRKSVSLFGYRIKLDGRPTYNPFTPLFSRNSTTSI